MIQQCSASCVQVQQRFSVQLRKHAYEAILQELSAKAKASGLQVMRVFELMAISIAQV
jgi:hypothetical protein